MVERVARLLCKQDGDDPDRICVGEGAIAGTTYPSWVGYKTQAQRIIAAMREPTAGMVSDGAFQIFHGERITEDDLAAARRVWDRMVKRALAEVA